MLLVLMSKVIPPTGGAPAAYLQGEIKGEIVRFDLPADYAVTIGRSETVTIQLDDGSVSRHHALLHPAEEQYFIADLGSSNGTYLNDKRISTPVMLLSGDRITIGNFALTFFCEATGKDPSSAVGGRTTRALIPRLVTVMVADIRDFTGLAQRVEPGVLSSVTGTLFQQSGKALQQRGAWGQKYIGDAIMAVWLHRDKEPGFNEMRAVFDGMSDVVAIAAGLQSLCKLDDPIRLGVGINTGLASIGNMGSKVTADYTAIGEVVNRAFRLEAASRELACDLVLGCETYRELSSVTHADRVFNASTVRMKGYEKPITAYTAQFSSLTDLGW
jgi:adenylate cyclase